MASTPNKNNNSNHSPLFGDNREEVRRYQSPSFSRDDYKEVYHQQFGSMLNLSTTSADALNNSRAVYSKTPASADIVTNVNGSTASNICINPNDRDYIVETGPNVGGVLTYSQTKSPSCKLTDDVSDDVSNDSDDVSMDSLYVHSTPSLDVTVTDPASAVDPVKHTMAQLLLKRTSSAVLTNQSGASITCQFCGQTFVTEVAQTRHVLINHTQGIGHRVTELGHVAV